MKRSATALVLMLLLAPSVFARNSAAGPGEIVRADYGSANHWVQVTDRVRSLVQNNSLNFRVDNDTLGVDPAPGTAKVLRLQLRDARGRIQRLNFRENSTVNLQVNGGNASLMSRLQITRAEYGADNRFTDVTSRLNSKVSNNRLSLQVNNSSMGGDPAQGAAKTLRVEYTYGGSPQQVVVNEDGQLNLPSNNATPSATNWGNTTIPSGTQLSVRTNESIDSKTATVGQKFSGVIAGDVLDRSGAIRIPNGSDAELVIRSTSSGSMTSGSDLVLDVDQVTVYGRRYIVSTVDLDEKGRQGLGANKRTAEMVGGGAVVGTLLGALLGGGKGAAIGAGAGAAAGAGTEVLTKGKSVNVPAETVLTFQLDQDLSLQMVR